MTARVFGRLPYAWLFESIGSFEKCGTVSPYHQDSLSSPYWMSDHVIYKTFSLLIELLGWNLIESDDYNV